MFRQGVWLWLVLAGLLAAWVAGQPPSPQPLSHPGRGASVTPSHRRQLNGYSNALSPSPQPLSHPGRGASVTPSPLVDSDGKGGIGYQVGVWRCQTPVRGKQDVCVSRVWRDFTNRVPVEKGSSDAPLPRGAGFGVRALPGEKTATSVLMAPSPQSGTRI